jgi:hypothetical protein
MAPGVTGKQIYGYVVRNLQSEGERPPQQAQKPEVVPPRTVLRRERAWYFSIGDGGPER